VRNHIWQVLLLIGAIGCAPAYVPPALTPTHPANAGAPEAPLRPPSTALTGDSVFPAAAAGRGKEAGEHDHGAMHGMSSSDGGHGQGGEHR
jgi:hypothetical protein